MSLLAVFRLRVTNSRRSSLLALTLLLLGLKLIWGGSLLQIGCGLGLLVCYSMALAGCTPFMPEAIGFLGLMCVGATRRLRAYRIVKPDGSFASQKPGLSVVLPFGMVVCFTTLFVLANPDLATGVSRQLSIAFDSLGRVLTGFNIGEAVLWLVSGFLLLGLLYPARAMLIAEKRPAELDQAPSLSGVYLAYRNTLLSVILLFAVYLVFEFSTLWFRNFPENFLLCRICTPGCILVNRCLGASHCCIVCHLQGIRVGGWAAEVTEATGASLVDRELTAISGRLQPHVDLHRF